jgi:membrane protease YdiL (CAAX protease family)
MRHSHRATFSAIFEQTSLTGQREDDVAKSRTIAVLLAFVFPTLITWVYFIALREQSDAIQKMAYGIGKTFQFALPVVWVCLYSRADFGYRKPRTSELFLGLTSGLVIAAAMWLLFQFVITKSSVFTSLQQSVREKIEGTGLNTFAMFLGTGVFYALCHSLMEEYYWRWFVFGQLQKLVNVPTAIVFCGLGFMAHHIIVLAVYFGWTSPLTYLLGMCIAIGGAGWAWMYHRFGTLYGVWLSHAIVDSAIFFIGYQMIKNIL